MHGFVGNTDRGWFEFLAIRPQSEVNFWLPSAGTGFAAISPGEPFFLRLKSPVNKIAGFGYLSRFESLPIWLAWQTFGPANGAPDLRTMCRQIERYRGGAQGTRTEDSRIGCVMVVEPVFLPQEQWIDEPADWSRNIVRGKRYGLLEGEGKRIFDECLAAAASTEAAADGLTADPGRRYADAVLVRPRLGQGSFRLAVMDAYRRACAVTTEHSLPVLEAAHIKPYAEGGEHRVSNGLLLRSDLHRLFDQGYVTITPQFRFEVSRHLKEDFQNGRSYYELHGRTIQIPANEQLRPDVALLAWHNNRYRS